MQIEENSFKFIGGNEVMCFLFEYMRDLDINIMLEVLFVCCLIKE